MEIKSYAALCKANILPKKEMRLVNEESLNAAALNA